MHSVLNQRQCHEQCKLGETLCLVLLVTSHTVIQKNIDTQTFNDYKHVNPYVSYYILCAGIIKTLRCRRHSFGVCVLLCEL